MHEYTATVETVEGERVLAARTTAAAARRDALRYLAANGARLPVKVTVRRSA